MSTKVRRQYQQSFHVIQDTRSQIREMIRNEMRDNSLRFICDIFRQEMESVCGPAFSRKGDERCHRGGSDPGSIVHGGQRVAVKKPRLKKNGQEVELQSYQALQGFDLLQDRVLRHMVAGVSTRDYEGLLNEVSGGLGLKKSSVSKAFAMGSREAFDSLNTRDLSSHSWAALMVDGIEFGGACVIAALGITTEGRKLILGLKRGDTENAEVCKDLFQELIVRGLKAADAFLFVTDGSKALKSAIRKVFGERFPVQRCIRHKERNCLSYLQKQHHAEFRRRWKLLHGITRFDEAKLEYERLLQWLKSKNEQASASLEEAEMETLTVIQLKAGATLRKTLLSTNPIESAFGKVRARSSRVKRWRKNGDQIERWSAVCLLEAEKGFRAIRGAKEIEAFLQELKNFSLPSQERAA
jgi:transposase-like protein